MFFSKLMLRTTLVASIAVPIVLHYGKKLITKRKAGLDAGKKCICCIVKNNCEGPGGHKRKWKEDVKEREWGEWRHILCEWKCMWFLTPWTIGNMKLEFLIRRCESNNLWKSAKTMFQFSVMIRNGYLLIPNRMCVLGKRKGVISINAFIV